MEDVLAIILGGGRGDRLYPLTVHRAKPALPLAGKYRLIDIPVSNCINSNIQKIFVLTQFNSASLNQHITNTYRFSPFMRGFVEVLAAQQTPASPDWFQGTADAVRKTLWLMERWPVRDYLILSGDHLYRMDYRHFLQHHKETNADVSISVIPIHHSAASNFGLMKTDDTGRVMDFREKPSGDALGEMRVDTARYGVYATIAADAPFLASMGIYVFRREVLIDLLKRYPEQNDFGKHIIPSAIRTHHVQSYLFQGYWEDIGTIDSFYRANLALVKQPKPNFSFFDSEFPIYTRARFLPPSKVLDTDMREVMISDGCVIKHARIVHSIVGIRMRLENNADIENTLLMGADYYQSDQQRADDIARGIPPVGIGEGTIIRNAIIDKNARIGKNVKILNEAKVQNADHEKDGYWIRNGIVVVIKDKIIPDGTVI
ncbi:MAG TPA: glucose-1-phosphate adenylyltransferase [Bacteroidota bacterium]|nr:glucose-1-phosphate adenylyltransferase [Bacteroidota bacterium]